jgi:riboflavin kinase, archaea type
MAYDGLYHCQRQPERRRSAASSRERAIFMPRLRGRVSSGRGDLAHWMVEYADLYRHVTGVPLVPGSLNVVLDVEYRLPSATLRLEPGEYGGRVAMNLVPCRIGDVPGFLLRTDQNEAGTGHHGREVVEIAAQVNLREALHLVDGDEVEIVIDD